MTASAAERKLADMRAAAVARQTRYRQAHPEASKAQKAKARRAGAALREAHPEDYAKLFEAAKKAGDREPWATALRGLKAKHAGEWRDLLATTA